jgi:putative peptide maturation system protein
MSNKLDKVLPESLSYLKNITQEKTQPIDVRAKLSALKKSYPELKIDLFAQEEAYDGSIHYNLLCHEVGEGSLSLSFCPEQTLPWPLRGVHRSREQDLVKVNDVLLTVGDAIAQIDFIWNEHPFAQRLVDKALIFQELQENPVDLTDIELQTAMNDFRIMHKLFTAEATHQWMKDRGLTHERFESLVEDYASVVKLRRDVTQGRIEEYFQQHQSDFRAVQIVYVIFSDLLSTQNMLENIHQEQVTFYEALGKQLFASSQQVIEQSFLDLYYHQDFILPKDEIFNASAGEMIGPLKTEKGFALINVLNHHPARLTREIENFIQHLLFQEWLDKKRQMASIEWYWG